MDTSSAEEFVRLFSKSQHRILGFVHTLVPMLAEAEDILQETSVILWKKWPEFERDKDFVKWACGIARLEVFRMLRQKKRSGLYMSESVLNQIADVTLAESKDKVRLVDGETALDACLQKLPKSDQKIVKLRYQQEMTVQQIAKECDRPKSTIHDLLGKIRSRLLRCVRRRLET
jgi:RNA polymerase sigma-70 factor (ECF subfamily)